MYIFRLTKLLVAVFVTPRVGNSTEGKQESCAIAKMTTQCTLCMSALKDFECALKI